MLRKSLKLFSVIVFMSCAALMVTSCSSSAGQTLTQAMVNFLEYETYQEDSQVQFTVQAQNPGPEEKTVLDFLNNLKIHSRGEVNVNDLIQSSSVTLAVDGREAEIAAYSDGVTSWVKFPFEERYVVFSPELASYDASLLINLQSQMQSMVKDVLKEFLKGFDYNSGAITSLGREEIKTADGQVQVEQILAELDTAQVRDLIVASLKHIQNSDTLLDVLLDNIEAAVLQSPEFDSVEDLYEGMSREELKAMLQMAAGELAADLESSQLIGDVSFDADLKFAVDGDNNLRQVEGIVKVLMTDTANPTLTNVFGWTFTTTYSRINEVGDIIIPTFSPEQTTDFQTWVEGSGEDAAEWFQEFSGIPIIKKNTVVFIQGSEAVSINGQNVTLPAPTYIKNGCTMIPAGVFVHHDLGISSTAGRLPSGNWRMVMTYNSNTLVMETGSRTAVINGTGITLNQAPEIKNGIIMVPLTETAKHLGYTYTWDPEAKSVTVILTDYGL